MFNLSIYLMKIGVIGSRDFDNYKLLAETLQSFNISLIVSGGAMGADALAHKFAVSNVIPFRVFKPNYQKYGRQGPLVRNSEIVKESDFILAFWDGKSKGTFDTICKAKRSGKPYKIVRF